MGSRPTGAGTRIGAMTNVVPPWASGDARGTIVRVWVVPGAARAGVAGTHGDALKVRVAAPAERGRATRAVLDLLAASVGAPVELEAGPTSRRKRVLVVGLEPAEVARRLAS